MAVNKRAKVRLETTADYQPLSDLNVHFYNRDINTAVLNFIVTRNQKPVLLGEDNVETNIILKLSDNSLIQDNLTIKDGMNGVVSYTLTTDILQRTGKVTGQVEIAIKGKEDTVVQRMFSFNISESLIESIDATTKLTYIKRFADLEKNIIERYERMEDIFSDGEELAKAVTDASNKGLDDIDIAKTSSLNEIAAVKTEGIDNIERLSENTLNEISTHKKDVETKIEKFNEDVDAAEYLKESETENWQKYKLTEEDGTYQNVDLNNDLEKLHDLKAGYYYAVNVPIENASSKAGFITVEKRSSSIVIYITFRPYNSTAEYVMRYNDIWTDWTNLTGNLETKTGAQNKANQALKEAKSYVDENISDSGWQDLPLMSGVEPDSKIGPSKYRVKNGICTVIFIAKMTVKETGVPFITLPDNALPRYSFSFLARTNGTEGKNPVKCSYEAKEKVFKIWQNGSNDLSVGDFIYGYITYIVG